MLESGNHDTNGMFPQLAGSIANLCAVPADLKVAMISTPGMVAQEARATLKTISTRSPSHAQANLRHLNRDRSFSVARPSWVIHRRCHCTSHPLGVFFSEIALSAALGAYNACTAAGSHLKNCSNFVTLALWTRLCSVWAVKYTFHFREYSPRTFAGSAQCSTLVLLRRNIASLFRIAFVFPFLERVVSFGQKYCVNAAMPIVDSD
jgi:hypothetical protein